jgi:hypothetical protein
VLTDIEARVAAVDSFRRAALRAATVRVAVTAVLALATLAAMIAVPVAAVMGAAACCEAVFKPRPWLLIVLFLASGVAVVAAGAALCVSAYRLIGDAFGRRYRRRFRETVVGPLLSWILPGSVVDAERGLARAELEQSALFPPDLNYDTAFRVDGRTADIAWTTGDVKAWQDVPSGPGTDSGTWQLTWLHGFYAWMNVPCPVSAPVFVVGEPYFSVGYGMTRRSDLVRGRTEDPEFDAEFHVCVSDDESSVPALPAELRRLLLDLRAEFGPEAFFALTPSGFAVAVPVYGRVLQDSRRLLEPRLLAANDAGELQREAEQIARVPQAAALLARSRRG